MGTKYESALSGFWKHHQPYRYEASSTAAGTFLSVFALLLAVGYLLMADTKMIYLGGFVDKKHINCTIAVQITQTTNKNNIGCVMIKLLNSIKSIEYKYNTGEEPVLVKCSDLSSRICKYSRSSGSAYKLACELIGNIMAKSWDIHAPEYCFVNICRQHIPNDLSPQFFNAPCIGTQFLKGVIDITSSSQHTIKVNENTLNQIIKIALFDFWIANEDRNSNNANLMYDTNNEEIIPIDFGCILNTATFDYKLTQLTSTDTILNSDLFRYISKDITKDIVSSKVKTLRKYYDVSLERCKEKITLITDSFPKQWDIQQEKILSKVDELFTSSWKEETWNNFNEQLIDNITYEQ